MSKEAHNHYLTLQESKEIKEIFPKATGNWEKDKKQFTKLYNENIKFIVDFENGNLEEDSQEDYIDDSIY